MGVYTCWIVSEEKGTSEMRKRERGNISVDDGKTAVLRR